MPGLGVVGIGSPTLFTLKPGERQPTAVRPKQHHIEQPKSRSLRIGRHQVGDTRVPAKVFLVLVEHNQIAAVDGQ